MMASATRAWTLLLACLLVAGCVTIGPGSDTRDRFDYNAAIADSAKEQTLLNIVKLRYADVPLFLEVESIVSGYTLETSVSLLGKAFESGAPPSELSLGGNGHYTDHPVGTASATYPDQSWVPARKINQPAVIENRRLPGGYPQATRYRVAAISASRRRNSG